MKVKFLCLPLLLIPALGGCTSTSSGGQTTSSDVFETHINGHMHLDFDNGALVVAAGGKPDARVSANGDLRIGDKAVAVTPAQRELLQRYYGEAASVRDDGFAIGKAGAALGINAASDALESLFSDGSKKKSDPDMEANNKKVEAAAQRLCGDMTKIKSTQGEIAAQLPAFAPYAVFDGETHCDKHEATVAR
ncbi:MAG: hypothetical protein JSS21_06385 [Proteobacteria bacterium]|nr:hypothetical protein [Pseudomonadota bacterium]